MGFCCANLWQLQFGSTVNCSCPVFWRCSNVCNFVIHVLQVPSVIDFDKEVEIEGPNNIPSAGSHPLAVPLPGRFLPLDQVIDLLETREPLPEVPPGRKEDVGFVVDNTFNVNRKAEGELHSVFQDDCGAWDKNGTTPRTLLWRRGNNNSQIVMREGKYCFNRKGKGIIEIEPQPLPNDVIQAHRYYVSLKVGKYQKRVTWFTQVHSGPLQHLAFHEYLGTWPGAFPHGNRQHDLHEKSYVRSGPPKPRKRPQQVPEQVTGFQILLIHSLRFFFLNIIYQILTHCMNPLLHLLFAAHIKTTSQTSKQAVKETNERIREPTN